ncbi:unnamed protein product [Amoebophrya sp. A120]|nr:unnamed protein product [Amoebophrya sp. A120]|eukprot:GSA120T00016788001.1
MADFLIPAPATGAGELDDEAQNGRRVNIFLQTNNYHWQMALPTDRLESRYEKLGHPIGEGTYGTVWKARLRTTGHLPRAHHGGRSREDATTSRRSFDVLRGRKAEQGHQRPGDVHEDQPSPQSRRVEDAGQQLLGTDLHEVVPEDEEKTGTANMQLSSDDDQDDEVGGDDEMVKEEEEHSDVQAHQAEVVQKAENDLSQRPKTSTLEQHQEARAGARTAASQELLPVEVKQPEHQQQEQEQLPNEQGEAHTASTIKSAVAPGVDLTFTATSKQEDKLKPTTTGTAPSNREPDEAKSSSARTRMGSSLFAMKKVNLRNEKEGFPLSAIREIRLLQRLDHPNIVRLKDLVWSEQEKQNRWKGVVHLVFEFVEHDLTGLLLYRKRMVSLPEVKNMATQILRGLSFLHGRFVVHRDLKLSNILVTNGGCLKLADFGLSRYLEDPATCPTAVLPPLSGTAVAAAATGKNAGAISTGTSHAEDDEAAVHDAPVLSVTTPGEQNVADNNLFSNTGEETTSAVHVHPRPRSRTIDTLLPQRTNRVITLWYRPPELLLGCKVYEYEVDVWSAGCVIAELLIGRPLFPLDNEKKVYQKISEFCGHPNPTTWPDLWNKPTMYPLRGEYLVGTGGGSGVGSAYYHGSFYGGSSRSGTAAAVGGNSQYHYLDQQNKHNYYNSNPQMNYKNPQQGGGSSSSRKRSASDRDIDYPGRTIGDLRGPPPPPSKDVDAGGYDHHQPSTTSRQARKRKPNKYNYSLFDMNPLILDENGLPVVQTGEEQPADGEQSDAINLEPAYDLESRTTRADQKFVAEHENSSSLFHHSEDFQSEDEETPFEECFGTANAVKSRFMAQMLSMDPTKREVCERILDHEFLRSHQPLPCKNEEIKLNKFVHCHERSAIKIKEKEKRQREAREELARKRQRRWEH